MKTTRYQFILQAESPVCHSSGTIGNMSEAMRRSVRQQDGTFARVPIITGDTLRHVMRERAAMMALDAAGLLGADGAGLTEGALRLLFNGGMLTGKGDASKVRLDEMRKMMDALPHLALFGGCANSQMLPGQMQVSDALLICQESLHTLTPWARAWVAEHGGGVSSCREHIDEETRVRMDSTRDPRATRLLLPEHRDTVERRQLAAERAHDTDDAKAGDAAKSSMMPRSQEVVVSGSLFAWDVTATTYDDLREDTLHAVFASLVGLCVVGGKQGTGHGRLTFLAGNILPIARPSELGQSMDLATMGGAVGRVFRAHMESQRDALRAVLREVDA